MIYSPQVPILKTEGGDVLDEVVCTTIITSPAVNAGVVRRNEGGNTDKIIPVMRKRIEKLLALCLHASAYYTGAGRLGMRGFQNDPAEIAELFKEALTGNFANQFKRVVFAVKTDKDAIIDPFRVKVLIGK